MRLCTFEVRTHLGRKRRLGALRESGIVDLNFACAWHLARDGEPRPEPLAHALVPDNMLEFLEGGSTASEHAARAVTALEAALGTGPRPAGRNEETLIYAPEEVTLAAPLPNPTSLRDFFGFEEHVRAGFEKRGEPMPREWYEMPVYYKGAHRSIVGPDADVLWPSFTEKLDYELELAAVIGREGRNVPAGEARAYIAGFTVMNDFSARDIQRREMKVRLGPAKGKDWCTAIGPVLVTPDEIGDPYALAMTASVNGEVWSRGSSSTLYWKFEAMIEFLTRDDTVFPGDVIGSGTVGGGSGLELDRWLRGGDVVELEIEKIGILRNRVVRH